MFAAATIGMDLISMSSYGLGGAALASRMTNRASARVSRSSSAVLLITAAG
jgi:hypothetical protein